MNRLYKLEPIVRKCLEDFPETRADDFKLIVHVYYSINPAYVTESFFHTMFYHKEFNLPPFESIRRARQKLQHDNENLRPSKITQEARAEEEETYLEYARGQGNE